jgi:lipoate-protein ligase A
MFETNGLHVKNYINDDEPYIYVLAPNKSLSFEGIRIYQIGGNIAFRVQREDTTHPYGKAYLLDVEDMFSDFMSENIKQEEAGKKVIKSVVSEVKSFFEKSLSAEKEFQQGQFDVMGDLDQTIAPTTGTDYANKVTSPGFGSSAGR